MGGIEVLGLAAGAMTTAAFVPQALRTWRTGSARDFSLPMLVLFCAGLTLWLVYGLMIGSASVVAGGAMRARVDITARQSSQRSRCSSTWCRSWAESLPSAKTASVSASGQALTARWLPAPLRARCVAPRAG